jgi:hypothetical protein
MQDTVEKDFSPHVEEIEQAPEVQSEIQEDIPENEPADNVEQKEEAEQEFSEQDTSKDLDKKWREQKKKLSKIQREKHRIAAEAEQLRIENENLKKFNHTSNQASQTHYENSLKLKLEQAKENKRKARELNDIETEIIADEDLASVVADIRSMENWKAQQMIQQYEIEQNQKQNAERQSHYDDSHYETNDQADRWIKQNSWFNEKSPHYDPDKAEDVLTYITTLDANLAKQGRDDEYFTKTYFDRINSYAKHYDQQRYDTRQQRMSAIPEVAPVRRTSMSKQTQFDKMNLTDDEKFMARNSGVSEDDWKKAKIEDIKKQTERMKFQNPIY